MKRYGDWNSKMQKFINDDGSISESKTSAIFSLMEYAKRGIISNELINLCIEFITRKCSHNELTEDDCFDLEDHICWRFNGRREQHGCSMDIDKESGDFHELGRFIITADSDFRQELVESRLREDLCDMSIENLLKFYVEKHEENDIDETDCYKLLKDFYEEKMYQEYMLDFDLNPEGETTESIYSSVFHNSEI